MQYRHNSCRLVIIGMWCMYVWSYSSDIRFNNRTENLRSSRKFLTKFGSCPLQCGFCRSRSIPCSHVVSCAVSISNSMATVWRFLTKTSPRWLLNQTKWSILLIFFFRSFPLWPNGYSNYLNIGSTEVRILVWHLSKSVYVKGLISWRTWHAVAYLCWKFR